MILKHQEQQLMINGMLRMDDMVVVLVSHAVVVVGQWQQQELLW